MRVAVAVDTETIGHGTLDKGATRLLANVTTLGFYLLDGYGFYIVVATNKEGGTAEGTGVVTISIIACYNTWLRVPIYTQRVPIGMSATYHKPTYNLAQVRLATRPYMNKAMEMIGHSLTINGLGIRIEIGDVAPAFHHPLPQLRIHTPWLILCSIIGICTSRYIA